MWVAAMIVFCGAFTALYAVALVVQGEALGAVLTLLGGLAVVAAGVVLFVLARRASARLDARGVSWCTMLGARSSVPWEQVHRVVVPQMHEPGEAVLLQLRDGSVVPIAALRKTQSPGDSTGAHLWYLRAGAAVVQAHQRWLTQNPPPGR